MLFTLGVLLVIFKLVAVITWSWWVVLIPFFIQISVFLLFMFTSIAMAVFND